MCNSNFSLSVFFYEKTNALINSKSRNDFLGNTSLINKFRLAPLIIFLTRVESVDPTKSSLQLLSLLLCGIYYLLHLHAHYLSSTIFSMGMYKKILSKVNILTDREINVLPKLSLNFSFLFFWKCLLFIRQVKRIMERELPFELLW